MLYHQIKIVVTKTKDPSMSIINDRNEDRLSISILKDCINIYAMNIELFSIY